MGEAERAFFPEAVEDKEEKKNDREKYIGNILKHLSEVNDFFLGKYVLLTRKRDFGFSKPEQFETLRRIKGLKSRLEESYKEDIEIIRDNHLSHILGNSIIITAGNFAKKFEEGKYFSEDGKEKPFPVEIFEMVKEGMELMIYYIGELEKDGELVAEEMRSRIGHLEKFIEYLSCDLPSQTTEQLKLFQFFRELEKGNVNRENLDVSTEKVQKYLDAEKIEKLVKF